MGNGVITEKGDWKQENGIAGIMTHRSYVEKRRVEWDEKNRKIV